MEIFEIVVVVLLFLIWVSVAGLKGVLDKVSVAGLKGVLDKEPVYSEAEKTLDVLNDIHELLAKQDDARALHYHVFNIDDIYEKLHDIEMRL